MWAINADGVGTIAFANRNQRYNNEIEGAPEKIMLQGLVKNTKQWKLRNDESALQLSKDLNLNPRNRDGWDTYKKN